MPQPDYIILTELFNMLTPVKQVIVYAAALKLERYELLAYLAPTIDPATKADFLKAVDRWLQ